MPNIQLIFQIIYAIVFFSYVVLAIFIVFHIFRYSLERSLALFGVTFFLVIFSILVFINATLFFSLPLDTLLPRSL